MRKLYKPSKKDDKAVLIALIAEIVGALLVIASAVGIACGVGYYIYEERVNKEMTYVKNSQ